MMNLFERIELLCKMFLLTQKKPLTPFDIS